MILLIDNYDSFTYNLYHYLGELGADVKVFRNNKITLDEIEALRPEKIVISPGPCTPKEAGISCDTITRFGARIPDSRRLPGPPGDRRGLRRRDRARAVDHARQIVGCEPRFADDLSPSEKSLCRHALSFFGDRSEQPTRRADGQRAHRRRRHHGGAPQELPGRRRAVSSRIDPHRRRQKAAQKLLRPLLKRMR